MKCTSNIFFKHFNEIPSLGVGFICHAISLHPQSIPSIPRQKRVKKSMFREISASKVSTVYINRDYMYPPPKDQALGLVDMWPGFWPC